MTPNSISIILPGQIGFLGKSNRLLNVRNGPTASRGHAVAPTAAYLAARYRHGVSRVANLCPDPQHTTDSRLLRMGRNVKT